MNRRANRIRLLNLFAVLALLGVACAPAATPVPTAPPTSQPAPTPAPPTATAVPPTLAPTAVPTSQPQPTQPPPTATETPAALNADLDTLFQKFTKAGSFSGAVLVARNGQIILSQGYGYADREKKIPNTPHTKFLIASMTEEFTAMAIMMLQEQGKLNVQDKFCQYLTGCPDAWKPITLHQLLTHTSGIPDNRDLFVTSEITSSVVLEQQIADVKSKPLDFLAGDQFSYSNMGYDLLGKIIEAVSGQTYGDFLQNNIFGPLQMSNTGFDPNRRDVAVGYQTGISSIARLEENLWVDYPAAGLYSTAEDLYRWDQVLYTTKLVSQKTLDAVFTPYVVVPRSGGLSYGYGWFIFSPAGQRHHLGHPGSVNGFISTLVRYMDDKVTVIILANQGDVDLEPIGTPLEAILFGK